jgi:hypothetical protein
VSHKVRRLPFKRLPTAILFVLAAPILLTVVGMSKPPVTLGATQPLVTIVGVSSDRLAYVGIKLLQPATGEHASIDKATARHIGAMHGGVGADTPVREVVLARVVQRNPQLDRLCWIVSLDPSGWFKSHGPQGAPQRQATFFLVFVDAGTGEWLFSDAGDNAT